MPSTIRRRILRAAMSGVAGLSLGLPRFRFKPAQAQSDSSVDGDAAVLIVSGTERLLDDVQAVEDLERVRALYGALETKEAWSWLLDATRSGEGVQIFIGAEDDLFSLTGCSVVVAPYTNSKEQIVGAIGVIGPTRLNYARVIPVVDYTAQVIGRVMG